MATAGRGVGLDAVEIMPNGKLAREKWLFLGIGNHDLSDGIVISCSVVVLTVTSSVGCKSTLNVLFLGGN